MVKKFIERPILASVISFIILLLGIVGMISLPITRFPEIAPPSVSVSASYPGAEAETVAESILLPLESRINGVEDMTYMNASASAGTGTIHVYFKQGTNPDQAAVNTQTRVSQAQEKLPSEVVQSGVTVTPRMSGKIMTLNVYSDDSDIDETFLQSYSNRIVDREISRIDGVAQVKRVGSRNYSMRVWLDPDRLKAYDLQPDDIKEAVQNQNFEIAPGKFGKDSDQTFETVIKYTGKLTSPEEFGDIVIKADKDGSILHLRDVAKVNIAATNTNNENRVDGKPGFTMNITQNNGANARQIDMKIRDKMEELSEDFPKGMKYTISYSSKNQVDASISQVLHTLVEAFILVFIVVFIFLQDFRATVIPAIAIPVSLTGTFFFIDLLGYTINLLTLFALVLSIGIVVDDAIVVVEAIHEKLESTKLKPKEAAKKTMREITPAIVSITLVMAAVFFPIGFMEGPSGVFYRQFAYTMAVAILLSAAVALTLTPALSALILKQPKKSKVSGETEKLPEKREENNAEGSESLIGKTKDYTGRFFDGFNTAFDVMMTRYMNSIKYLVKNPKLSILGLVVVSALGFWLMKSTPSAFIPDEDDGFIAFSLNLPAGSSLARTNKKLQEVTDTLIQHDEIKSLASSAGYNGVDETNSTSYAIGYISMYPHGERKGIKHIQEFIDTVRSDLSEIGGAEINVFQRPTVQGFGEQSGLRFVLEDQMEGNLQTFGAVSDSILNELNNRPEILSANTTFDANYPQYELSVDDDKAMAMGVKPKDMLNNFRMYFSRYRASDFILFNRMNYVYFQAPPEAAATASSFNNIYVRNDDDEMVPVNNLAKLKKTFGPEIVTRYNMFNSVEVNAEPAEGYSTGNAMDAVSEVMDEDLPGNYKYEWTGMSLEEKKAGGQTVYILLLSILFVYFFLSAQYESYIIPLSIILSIPVGLIGVYSVINLVGLQNNIYVQVGLIMLIGLLAKNAILIVEYAEQQRRSGNSIYKSALKGAQLRLRPILMTSFAFVVGLIPLTWTSGPSAQGNHSISFGAIGGMLSGVILGVFVVPVLFVLFKKLDEYLRNPTSKTPQ